MTDFFCIIFMFCRVVSLIPGGSAACTEQIVDILIPIRIYMLVK